MNRPSLDSCQQSLLQDNSGLPDSVLLLLLLLIHCVTGPDVRQPDRSVVERWPLGCQPATAGGSRST